MATSSTPIRLDADLTATARKVAPKMSRSVAEQISHWARIGRELERSPDVSLAAIRKVLDGAVEYDALPAKEQAIVRAEWMERMESLRDDLRLDRTFEAAGLRYAELDAEGRVTVREPKPARGKVRPIEQARKKKATHARKR